MIRRLFTIASAVSLLLCIGIGFLLRDDFWLKYLDHTDLLAVIFISLLIAPLAWLARITITTCQRLPSYDWKCLASFARGTTGRCFTRVSMLSLLFGLSVVVFWIRSYWAWDCLYIADDRRWFVASNRGEFGYGEFRQSRFNLVKSSKGYLVVSSVPGTPKPYYERTRWSLQTTDAVDLNLNRNLGRKKICGGLGRECEVLQVPTEGIALGAMFRAFPDWLLIAILSVLPVLQIFGAAARKLNQRQAMRLSLCHCCRYDLRASNDRCPECGTPISVATTSS